MANRKGADLGLNLTAAMQWRGAWAIGATYTANDVVSRAYSLWLALQAVPAAVDPAAAPGFSRVGAWNGDVTLDGNRWNLNTFGRVAYEFTVNTATTVTAIEIGMSTSGALPAGATIGIASAIGTTAGTPNTVWIGKKVTTSALPAGAWTQVILDTPAALSPGTTYFIAIEGVEPGYLHQPATNVLTGVMATLPRTWAGGQASTYYTASYTGYMFSVRIDGNQAYWTKIAEAANQKNVGQVAASGAAVTIADPELQPITRIVLSANVTITLPPVAVGKSFKVVLVQDGTGARTVTWAASPSVLWPGGAAPTQTATALKGDVYEFFADGSANWLGRVVAQNY